MMQHTPYQPVVTPRDFYEHSSFESLFGEGDVIDVTPIPEVQAAAAAESAALAEKRKRFFAYGMVGVGIGALVTGTMTALAFNSYRRSESAVTPAVYTAIGSMAVGGAMVWLLSRAMGGEDLDPRLSAMAVGAKMSV